MAVPLRLRSGQAAALRAPQRHEDTKSHKAKKIKRASLITTLPFEVTGINGKLSGLPGVVCLECQTVVWHKRRVCLRRSQRKIPPQNGAETPVLCVETKVCVPNYGLALLTELSAGNCRSLPDFPHGNG